MTFSFANRPDYDHLPNKGRFWEWGPPGSHKEALGKLNLPSSEVVAGLPLPTASEIKTGERVGLGWEFHNLDHSPFKRTPYQMNIVPVW